MSHAHAGGLALVVLGIVLLAAIAPTLRRRSALVAAVALIALSIVWLRVNRPMEGGTILPISDGHGVTVADMVSVGGLAAAAYTLLRSMRR